MLSWGGGVQSAHLKQLWTSRGPSPSGSSLRRCARIATTLAAVHPAHGVAIVEVVSGDGVLRSMSLMAILRQPSHGPTVEIPPETAHLPPYGRLKLIGAGLALTVVGIAMLLRGVHFVTVGDFINRPPMVYQLLRNRIFFKSDLGLR